MRDDLEQLRQSIIPAAQAELRATVERLTDPLDAFALEVHDSATLTASKLGGVSATLEDQATELKRELARLSRRIDTFSKDATKRTNRLLIATWALAIAALVVAGIGAYATMTAAPQIIIVSAPSTPPIVVTPAASAAPGPSKR
jgi:hypothetical protein